ncbi:MAG: spore germination protein GerW family protein [Pseudomonadota bacterium]
MADVERLLKGTVEELERLLNAKHVLAEPIEKDGATVIPIVSYGFGFGAGGGEDSKSGNGGGTGAGGGIKPLGAIVIDDQGVRVESAKSGMSSVFEAMADCCSKMMEHRFNADDENKGNESAATDQA